VMKERLEGYAGLARDAISGLCWRRVN